MARTATRVVMTMIMRISSIRIVRMGMLGVLWYVRRYPGR